MGNGSSSVNRQSLFFFAGTILVSSFLLFLVQPLISKYILPWFGGGTAVWTTAMMFFQLVLLGGYLYAHWLGGRRSSTQVRVHSGVMLVAGGWILVTALAWGVPLLAGASFRPGSADAPMWDVLLILLVSVGVPYFLLSTTSTLVQFWFGRLTTRGQPYRFYILSNAASLAALLSYPLLVEPNLTLHSQALFWSTGFFIFLLLLGLVLHHVARNAPDSGDRVDPAVQEDIPSPPPGARTRILWVFLATCASMVLLSGTNELTQDLASVPFLWVLPLSLYLLSFMVAFSDRYRIPKGVLIILTLASIGFAMWAQVMAGVLDTVVQIVVNAAVVFFACLLCHREVYERRPAPRFLTSFYLMISIGGALGGVLVNLVAPVLFEGYWEYQVGLALIAMSSVFILYQNRQAWSWKLRVPISVVGLAATVLLLIFPLYIRAGSLWMERNFYGVIRVRQGVIDGVDSRRMMHGTTMHGLQALDEAYRMAPTTYYTAPSGIGLAFRSFEQRPQVKPLRVGVVGLGIGSLAVYGNAGDVFRFYELDPAVIRLAQNERYFTYLRDTPAKVEIIPGDARLALERELASGSQQYDLLVVDAFSGDSIPVHLLTREAFEVYLAHINPQGMLAVHISNKHVNLEPVLDQTIKALGVQGRFFSSDGARPLGNLSWWVLIAPKETLAGEPALLAASRDLNGSDRVRLWRDDFSNLFQVLR